MDSDARHDANEAYGDGYQSGVRDAQIELFKAIQGLDGARVTTILGYDVPDLADEMDLSGVPEVEQWRLRCLFLTKDVEIERRRSKTWQQLAGRYDDVRDWLRTCPNTPEGYAQFYARCADLIFEEQ